MRPRERPSRNQSPDRASATIVSTSACSCRCSTRSVTSARRSRRCRRSASTASSSSCSPTAARRTVRARSCRSWRAHDPRIRVIDNPLRRTASGLNACLREARGEYRRADGRPHLLRRPLPGGGRRAPAPRRHRVGQRSGDPQADRRRSPAPSRSRWPPGWGAAARASGTTTPTPREERDLDTGVFGGVWRREKVLAERRLGRALADQPGLRDGLALPCATARAWSACRRWPVTTCRATR